MRLPTGGSPRGRWGSGFDDAGALGPQSIAGPPDRAAVRTWGRITGVRSMFLQFTSDHIRLAREGGRLRPGAYHQPRRGHRANATATRRRATKMCSWWGAVVSAKSAAEKKSMSSMATATASPRLTASPTNRNRKLVRIPEAPKRDLLSFVSVGRHALSPGHVLTIRSPRVGRRPFPSRRVSRRRKRQPLSLRGRCSFDARRRSVPLALQDGAACGILGAAERRDVHQRIRLCEAGPQDPPREVPRRPSVGGAGRARPGPPPDARQGVDPPGEPAQVRRRSTGCGSKDRGADPPDSPDALLGAAGRSGLLSAEMGSRRDALRHLVPPRGRRPEGPGGPDSSLVRGARLARPALAALDGLCSRSRGRGRALAPIRVALKVRRGRLRRTSLGP